MDVAFTDKSNITRNTYFNRGKLFSILRFGTLGSDNKLILFKLTKSGVLENYTKLAAVSQETEDTSDLAD